MEKFIGDAVIALFGRPTAHEDDPERAVRGRAGYPDWVAVAGWIESLGRAADHAEMLAHHYLAALDLARAASQDITVLAPRARTALQAAALPS